MRITVLTVPECPNAHVVEGRLTRALDGRAADVERVEVGDPEQAARLGMTGSPTVLIDGVDPFGMPGTPASLSCRLYRGPDGRVEGAPSVADLRRALAEVIAAVDRDCPPTDAADRGGQGRLAPVAGGLRTAYCSASRAPPLRGHRAQPLDQGTGARGRRSTAVAPQRSWRIWRPRTSLS